LGITIIVANAVIGGDGLSEGGFGRPFAFHCVAAGIFYTIGCKTPRKVATLARKIWSEPANPGNEVARQLGITRSQLRAAIHEIKASNNLSGAERVIIYDDGTVTNEGGEYLGNIHDEL
jgi:hypothetical protein